jgi:hypothetical protein
MGKGSKRRPSQVSVSVFEDNYDQIFGDKPKEKKAPPPVTAKEPLPVSPTLPVRQDLD